MSKVLFSERDTAELKRNPYVKNVTAKGITYTDEFKEIFINEYNNGMMPAKIFLKYGFSVKTLGYDRIWSCAKRWKKQSLRDGGLVDTRKHSSGRPRTKPLTLEEKYKRLQHKALLLEQENAFLKKIQSLEKGKRKK